VITCPHESELWEAVAAGRWPETASMDLRVHVASCAVCWDFAEVAMAVQADAADSRLAAAPPSSAIVWWRAQMRARQEAARAADRPITIVQALAISAGVGITLALLSLVVPWLRPFIASAVQSVEGFTTLPALGLTQQWGPVLAGALFVTLVLAPVAVYLVFEKTD
jgi:hypothetical protein